MFPLSHCEMYEVIFFTAADYVLSCIHVVAIVSDGVEACMWQKKRPAAESAAGLCKEKGMSRCCFVQVQYALSGEEEMLLRWCKYL